MIKNLKLPQNLFELSNIIDEDFPVTKWSVDNWSGAVIFLIVENYLVLIKRSKTMPTHKDQIGFMGGHRKKGESMPVTTAFREFSEESALDSSLLCYLGVMHPIYMSHEKIVIPVMAKYLKSRDEFLKNVKSNGEWDDLVLVPLEYLSTPCHWTHATSFVTGGSSVIKNYSIYFSPLIHSTCIYLSGRRDQSYMLWGASAKMVVNFFQKHFYSAK